MKTIAFHTPSFDCRGTCVAIYDYAKYFKELYGGTSIILCPVDGYNRSDNDIKLKFSQKFSVFPYRDLNKILSKMDVDILYQIKYGTDDGIVGKGVKNVIHCVFDLSQPHGDVYAGVSSALVKKFGDFPYVPHMLTLDETLTDKNMRNELSIPAGDKVFGRMGGMDTFNLEFCKEVIINVLKHSGIWFLFANTPKFVNHPRAIFLNRITNPVEKLRFINTLDAGLECGTMGHSWGLFIGEVSICGKPNIVYNGDVLNTAHIEMLGDDAMYFNDKASFQDILLNFDKHLSLDKDWWKYRKYTPKYVMDIFMNVFVN
jgi:hypothetical protein